MTIEPKHDRRTIGSPSRPGHPERQGLIIVAKGGKADKPITVDITGVTVDANGVDATAGIVFLDAQGSVERSLVTGLDVDESAGGYAVPGGFRSNAFGIGIAAVTRVGLRRAGTRRRSRRGR